MDNSYLNTADEAMEMPRSPNALRTAVVGLGRMGLFHAGLIAGHVADLDVVVIGDTRRDALDRAALIFPDAATVANGLDVLDHDQLDACVVVTSTSEHRTIVEAALNRGLHVFCEKPITLDPREVLHLAGKAEALGLVLQTGFWRRFSPAWVAAREAIAEGAIGVPLLVRSSQWDAALPPLEFCDRSVSGGLWVDCGVHEFDVIEWMCGLKVRALQAVPLRLAVSDLAEVGDVDNGLLLLEMEDGTAGVIDISRNGAYVDEVRMEILGTLGSILLTTEPYGSATLRTRSGVEELAVPSAMSAFAQGVVGEMTAFSMKARGEEVSVPNGHDDARALRLALAAWESLDKGGRRVAVTNSGRLEQATGRESSV